MTSAVETAFRTALFDPDAALPTGLRAWNGSDPARRFAVYRNNVAVSLREALARRYPIVEALVGAEFFAAVAGLYCRSEPPSSPLIFEYGRTFPAFLAAFPPLAGLPYVADVALVENARGEALHAADAAPVPDAAFARLDGGVLAGMRIEFLPSLRLIRSRFPVVSIIAAHEGPQGREAADLSGLDLGCPEDALVARPEDDVETHALAPGVALFLLSLAAGGSVAEAAEAGASEPGFDPVIALATLMRGRLARGLVPSQEG